MSGFKEAPGLKFQKRISLKKVQSSVCMEKKLKALVLGKRWSHHSAHSGYDALLPHLDVKILQRPDPLKFGDRFLRRVFARRWKRPTYRLDYRYEDLWVERKAIFHAAFGNYAVTHCIYGDEQLDLLLRQRKKLNSKLVATFHLPWNQSRIYFERMGVRWDECLDGAIAVSSDLASSLAGVFGEGKVAYIPHGIDTDFFRPGSSPKKRDRLSLLTVGFHKRDLELVHRLANECQIRKVPVDLRYIGPKEASLTFTGCANVKCEANVSETDLLRAYQTAHALLLPVTSATANNSLLEALAAGLPVISTTIGGIPDYLDSGSGWLLPPGDLGALFGLVEILAHDASLCHEKETAARNKAETFSWTNVASQVRHFYGQVASRPSRGLSKLTPENLYLGRKD